MPHDVCRWWYCYFFDNPLRRWIYNPGKLFGEHVQPGMTILDVGCGMGFNSLGLARLVGPSGRVLAVDMQPQMLRILLKRAARQGLQDRIEAHLCSATAIGIAGPVDFAAAFWMVHETPDIPAFLRQIRDCLRPAGSFLIAEPVFHVTEQEFGKTLDMAREAGFTLSRRPRIAFSRSAVLHA